MAGSRSITMFDSETLPETIWFNACAVLMAEDPHTGWLAVQAHSPPPTLWHSIFNCSAHQLAVWQQMLAAGVQNPSRPAAFQLAILMRHIPSHHVEVIVTHLLTNNPEEKALTAYILTLLRDDDPSLNEATEPVSPLAAPLRDLQLFGDSELAVLGAPQPVYDSQAELVREEYRELSDTQYIQLRIKVLEQFSRIPVVFHTPEFKIFESLAKDNILREIDRLKTEI